MQMFSCHKKDKQITIKVKTKAKVINFLNCYLKHFIDENPPLRVTFEALKVTGCTFYGLIDAF